MLTRKEIEKVLTEGEFGEIYETALALYQENEGLSRAYKEANDLLIEAATENESLRTACDDITNKVEVVEAENARLREELDRPRSAQACLYAQEITHLRAQNEALRAVVEAAKEAVVCVGFADMMATCPSVRAELEPIRDKLLAALKGLEGK